MALRERTGKRQPDLAVMVNANQWLSAHDVEMVAVYVLVSSSGVDGSDWSVFFVGLSGLSVSHFTAATAAAGTVWGGVVGFGVVESGVVVSSVGTVVEVSDADESSLPLSRT